MGTDPIYVKQGYVKQRRKWGLSPIKKARLRGPFRLLPEADSYIGLMFVAWSPFGPVVTSKETFWPSFRLLKPEP